MHAAEGSHASARVLAITLWKTLAFMAFLAAPPVFAAALPPPPSSAPSPAGPRSIPNLIESREASTAVLPPNGSYIAGDDMVFVIDHQGGETRLRFAGDDEIFVLTVDRAAMGGRILKYDTGDAALAVTGWAGVTIYTRGAPEGLPADRTGDGPHLMTATPNSDDLHAVANAWAHRLQQNLALTARFDPNWEQQLVNDDERRLIVDAMLNTERAFARVQSDPRARLNPHTVDSVRIGEAKKAGAIAKSGVLTVTIATGHGLFGRPSSLAIAQALLSSH